MAPPQEHAKLWRFQHGRDAAAPLPLRVKRLSFQDVPGWAADAHEEALGCYLKTAFLLQKAFYPGFEFAEMAYASRNARPFFEEHFIVERVQEEEGLLTAYYEPHLEGARQRGDRFRFPIYQRPADLAVLPQGHPLLSEGLTAGCLSAGGHGIEPYATRHQIEEGALDGRDLEIAFVEDPIALFFMHVQGSGVITLEDGSTLRLTFDGKNGHPYTSIGKFLIASRRLDQAEATLDGIVAWLHAHSSETPAILAQNKSFIFFKELDKGATGPQGSSGVTLTQGRSLAVDPNYHPLGSLIFVRAPSLDYEASPFQRLMVAQDTGSAIVGPQRGDLFAGSGLQAGKIAGHVRQPCEFFRLRPLKAAFA